MSPHKQINHLFTIVLVALVVWTALGCDGIGPFGSSPDGTDLKLVASYPLDIAESSGLTMDPAGTALWAIGSRQKRVFKLDLEGRVLAELAYKGDDPEGLVFDPADSTLWIVEERRREIVQLNQAGRVLDKKRLDLEGDNNSGLEGICLDRQGALYILNEKNPGLFLHMDAELSIAAQDTLDFARDYSGMAYGMEQDRFWILSDQDKRLFARDRAGNITASYKLPLPQPEGIAVDEKTRRMYVVSDSKPTLYVFEFAE